MSLQISNDFKQQLPLTAKGSHLLNPPRPLFPPQRPTHHHPLLLLPRLPHTIKPPRCYPHNPPPPPHQLSPSALLPLSPPLSPLTPRPPPLMSLHPHPQTSPTHVTPPSPTHVTPPTSSTSHVSPSTPSPSLYAEDPPSISTPSNLSTPPTETLTMSRPSLPPAPPTLWHTHTHTHRPQRRQRLPAAVYYGCRRLRKSRNNSTYEVNLSFKTLSRDTINLLSKGLGYAPVPAPPDRSNLNEDLEALARRLRITHHFQNSRRQGKKHPKSQWNPPKASNKKLEEYIEKTLAE